MQFEKILVPSEWGTDLSIKHIKNSSTSVAVLFPGQNYSCKLPLLYYTGKSALDAGYDLIMLSTVIRLQEHRMRNQRLIR